VAGRREVSARVVADGGPTAGPKQVEKPKTPAKPRLMWLERVLRPLQAAPAQGTGFRRGPIAGPASRRPANTS
jgi:hypothetical protein